MEDPARVLDSSGGGATSLGYRKPERAYHVSCPPGRPSGAIDLELAANEASPVVNPAFVVRGWGEAPADVSIDGKLTPNGPTVRVGYNRGLEGTDLVVWIGLESSKNLRVRVARGRA